MRQPHSLDEAKTIYREEKGKLLTAVHGVIGSRAVLAGLTMLMVGFGAHTIYAPTRLPPIRGISLAQAGLPPSLDFGAAGEAAKELRDAAVRQGASDQVTTFVTAHQDWIPAFNQGGFALCALLLVWNLFAAAQKWREGSVRVVAP